MSYKQFEFPAPATLAIPATNRGNSAVKGPQSSQSSQSSHPQGENLEKSRPTLKLIQGNPFKGGLTRSELIQEWVRQARDLSMWPLPDDMEFLQKQLSMKPPEVVRKLLDEYTNVWLEQMAREDLPVHQRCNKGRHAANTWLRTMTEKESPRR